MGGGTSRFEETDWNIAHGRLSSTEETIDGAPPTSKYRVYTLHKRAVNQREYDVTDEESNLLYSTRIVEGTLAWFDVLGPGIDQYLLRVQVDLSRRYWVIYSFGSPVFSGQFPDMEATARMREVRGEDRPCLYKRACITVSWSRYHAIVNRYGPAPEKNEEQEEGEDVPSWVSPAHNYEDILRSRSTDEADSSRKILETEMNETQPVIGTRKTAANVAVEVVIKGVDSALKDADEKLAARAPSHKSESAMEKNHSVKKAARDPMEIFNTGSKVTNVVGLDEEEPPHREFDHDDDDGLPGFASVDPEALQSAPKRTKSKRSKHGKKKGLNPSDLPPNPLQGYLLLDKPLLKCEEINSFMGQHQTMLVGKEEAIELERQELEAAAEIGADAHNPDANYKSRMSQGTPEIRSHQIEASIAPDGQANNFPSVRKFAKWVKVHSHKPSNTTDSLNNDNHESDEFDVIQEAEIGNESNMTRESEVETTPMSLDSAGSRNLSAAGLGSQANSTCYESLIGFWSWDNTVRVHKMKMHVAAGSDLALHVVLAIVTNQLRLERNVVVSTV